MENFLKLTRTEMKKVVGGLEEPACGDKCNSDSDCPQNFVCKADGPLICPNQKVCTI